MIFVNIKRIIKSGFINFWRNGWVSLATVIIMFITLFIIGSLVFLNVLLTSTLSSLEDKVDISIYFKNDAQEERILSLKRTMSKLEEVKNIDYVSREEALNRFRERHKDNALINQSLTELNENPLGASFNIKAKDPSQFGAINNFLESSSFDDIIDKINYRQNQLVINRLSEILSSSRKIGFSITVFMVVVAILVSFNTIRLAIYTSREEISIMRLVGASNNYIRGPFIVEGAFYGLFSSILATIIFYPVTYWLAGKAQSFFGPPNIFNYYLVNFFEIFILLMFVGVFLGSFSSIIAVRRYLKI